VPLPAPAGTGVGGSRLRAPPARGAARAAPGPAASCLLRVEFTLRVVLYMRCAATLACLSSS